MTRKAALPGHWAKCTFPGCGRTVQGRGLCEGHYNQLRRGKPLAELWDRTSKALFDGSWSELPGTPDASFAINSPKYGRFVVRVPARYRDDLRGHQWHVLRNKTRSEGAQFFVAAQRPLPGGKQTLLCLHVLVWQLLGRRPVTKVDHVDCDPLNNSESNLRDGSIGNSRNVRVLRRTNTSGMVGVSWHKAQRKWIARIHSDGKKLHLGGFDDIESARKARDEAALRLHGEFAVLNGPVGRAVPDGVGYLSHGNRRAR
jgi:hypothetical protein